MRCAPAAEAKSKDPAPSSGQLQVAASWTPDSTPNLCGDGGGFDARPGTRAPRAPQQLQGDMPMQQELPVPGAVLAYVQSGYSLMSDVERAIQDFRKDVKTLQADVDALRREVAMTRSQARSDATQQDVGDPVEELRSQGSVHAGLEMQGLEEIRAELALIRRAVGPGVLLESGLMAKTPVQPQPQPRKRVHPPEVLEQELGPPEGVNERARAASAGSLYGRWDFIVFADRSSSRSLGIDIDDSESRYLKVEAVRHMGLISQWNREQRGSGVELDQQQQVEVGDHIVAVNGICGNTATLSKEVRKAKPLWLGVVKGRGDGGKNSWSSSLSVRRSCPRL